MSRGRELRVAPGSHPAGPDEGTGEPAGPASAEESLLPANSFSCGVCGTGTVPTRASRPYSCAVSSASRLELHCTVLPSPDKDSIYKDLLSQLVQKHSDTWIHEEQHAEKTECRTGAKAVRVQSRSSTKAARSQGAPGGSAALGGGRSSTSIPAPSATAAGGRGGSGARCAWGRVRGPWCGELSPEQLRGSPARALQCPEHPWVPRLVPVPCAEWAVTVLLPASLAPPSRLPFWLAPPHSRGLLALAPRAGAVVSAGLAKPGSPSDAHSAARHFIILLETHTAPAQLEPRVLAINMLCPD